MRPLKPRPLAVESRAPSPSGTLIVAKPALFMPAIPDAAPTDRDEPAFDLDSGDVFSPSTTAPVSPRVVAFEDLYAHTPTDPVMYPRQSRHHFESVDDFYGFAPRPSEPLELPRLPRMITDHDLLRKKPSLAGRVARKFVSFVAVAAVLAIAIVAAFAYVFKVPVNTANAKSLNYEKVVAYTQVSPVEHEPVVAAPLGVHAHALFSLSTPAPAAPRLAPRSGPVATTRL